jgi:hypothetical protein
MPYVQYFLYHVYDRPFYEEVRCQENSTGSSIFSRMLSMHMTQLFRFSDFETWMNAVRALVILSVVAEVIGIVLLIFYIKREDGHANLTRIRAAIILCVLAGITVVICIIL